VSDSVRDSDSAAHKAAASADGGEGRERRLVWTDRGTLGDLDGLPAAAAVALDLAEIPDRPLSHPDLTRVRALIPPLVRNRADQHYDLETLLPAMTGLEYVQALSAGVDSIVGLIPDGVTLCSVRGAYDDLMAELLLAGILAVYKDFPHYVEAQRRGVWEPRRVQVLGGAEVLFVGYGSIAQCLEGYLAPFRIRSTRVARTARDGVAGIEELPKLLPQADVVVVLTPLTAETAGLVDTAFLALMKPGALLVNGARGQVADTGAVLAAAQEGRIRAFLDVTEPEPLPDGHPLYAAPGILITPHIGSLVAENRRLAFAVVRDNLARWALGEPLRNVVRDGY
jgi:phosphoglycerate dehydrogenase-like enzyme